MFVIEGTLNKRILKYTLLFIALALACEKPAAAYADPGSGAMGWQLLVSFFVGGLFYLRRFASRIKSKERAPKD